MQLSNAQDLLEGMNARFHVSQLPQRCELIVIVVDDNWRKIAISLTTPWQARPWPLIFLPDDDKRKMYNLAPF